MKKTVTQKLKAFDARFVQIEGELIRLAIGRVNPNPFPSKDYYVLPNTKEVRHRLRMMKCTCYGVMRLWWCNEGTFFGHQPKEANKLWVSFEKVYH